MKFEDIKTGDILVSSWGYDMTIVDFYKVVSKRGTSTVVLQKLCNDYPTGNGFQGHTVPSDIPDGTPFKARLTKSGSIKLSSYKYIFSKWNGKPAYYNHLD